jgi:hypothetical protein
MSTPSAIWKPVSGSDTKTEHIAQFYGYLADAPDIGGCYFQNCAQWNGSAWLPCHPPTFTQYCYSVFTIASLDQGASWEFRSTINWDSTQMPRASEGPNEVALTALPGSSKLLSVFRLGARNPGAYHLGNSNLWQAISADGGRSVQHGAAPFAFSFVSSPGLLNHFSSSQFESSQSLFFLPGLQLPLLTLAGLGASRVR